MRLVFRSRIILFLVVLALAAACRPAPPIELTPSGPAVRMVYFYQEDCSHCQAIEEEVLRPLQESYGERIEILWVETTVANNPRNYELLVRTHEAFEVSAAERDIPTLVIDGQIMIGEDQIREELPCLLDSCLAAGGTAWPDLPGLDEIVAATPTPGTAPLIPPFPGQEPGGGVVCAEDTPTGCASAAPIWVAYFYQVGCRECNLVEQDIEYVRTLYPQMIVDAFNINDDLPLAQQLAEDAGRLDNLHTPAIFIGQGALIGREEITPQSLAALVEEYAPTGAEKVWDTDLEEPPIIIPSVLTVLLAGLLDGLNPCAFATLIFFISYLTASQRKGREVLIAGAAFTLGVFVAYLAMGLGLYKLWDTVWRQYSWAQSLSSWVYGLTALLCAVLAILSLLDFVKAQRGQIKDMRLVLPNVLRKRARAAIRTGQRTQAFVAAAFATGLVVSLLELACTGQIYLAMIIYMTSVPELRSQGTLYLVLYNLVFILPLVVVFVLTYFGTTSLQLGRFLEKRTAAVKLGTAIVFAALAAWLVFSLIAR